MTSESTLDQLIAHAIEQAKNNVDDSRENSLTITKLEEARSWNGIDASRKAEV